MNSTTCALLVCTAAVLSSCGRATRSETDEPTRTSTDAGHAALSPGERRDRRWGVSIFELLARPEDFSGQILTVTGYLRMDVEEQLLYASEEFARIGVLENAVAIDVTGCMANDANAVLLKNLESLRDSYVSVTGRFMKTDPRRNVFQAGRLCSIHKVVAVTARAKSSYAPDAGQEYR